MVNAHPRGQTVLAAIVAALLGFAAACGGSDNEDGLTTIDVVSSSGQRSTLSIEIADTIQERTTGLSGRTELAEDAGMLFIIPQRGAGFWMKDTLIPLSVAFLGECGEIVHIADMEPQTQNLHNTERPYSFGLEVNQGWFADRGIGVGGSVRLPEDLKLSGCP